MEALNIAADWTYPAPISRTPIYVYSLVLLFDYVLYSLLAAALIERTHSATHRKAKASTHTSFMSNSGNNDRSTEENEDEHSNIFYRHAISWGMWILGAVGGICRVTVWAVSKSAEYIWGQQLHSYSSLSQEQRSYVDNIDTDSASSQEISRRNKDRKRVQQSRSAHDVRARTAPPAVLGSRSVGNLNIRVDLEMRHTNMELEEHSACERQGERNREGEEKGERKGEARGEGGRREEVEEKGMPSSSSKDNRQDNVERKTCMRILDLSKEYVTDRTNVVILHRVTAELRQGTVTCLLGKS